MPPLAISLDDVKSKMMLAVNLLNKDTPREFVMSSIIVLVLFVQQVEGT